MIATLNVATVALDWELICALHNRVQETINRFENRTRVNEDQSLETKMLQQKAYVFYFPSIIEMPMLTDHPFIGRNKFSQQPQGPDLYNPPYAFLSPTPAAESSTFTSSTKYEVES